MRGTATIRHPRSEASETPPPAAVEHDYGSGCQVPYQGVMIHEAYDAGMSEFVICMSALYDDFFRNDSCDSVDFTCETDERYGGISKAGKYHDTLFLMNRLMIS